MNSSEDELKMNRCEVKSSCFNISIHSCRIITCFCRLQIWMDWDSSLSLVPTSSSLVDEAKSLFFTAACLAFSSCKRSRQSTENRQEGVFCEMTDTLLRYHDRQMWRTQALPVRPGRSSHFLSLKSLNYSFPAPQLRETADYLTLRDRRINVHAHLTAGKDYLTLKSH